MTIVPPPDTKDWTWVLEQPCPECGFEPDAVASTGLGAAFRANGAAWRRVLLDADDAVRARPRPDVWSPLEYGCHVRDVHEVFAARVRAMVASTPEEPARFANWDQDETALAGDYPAADPAAVAEAIVAGSGVVADLYDAVTGPAWQLRGLRSNGSAFTVASLGTYHLHDVVHHLHDVGA